jgi:hypothetical protein
MASDGEPLKQLLYERVCDSYQAVDDFRMKLLGLLPVATGTAVFLLLSGDKVVQPDASGRAAVALLAIGAFGFLFTSGLLAYELFGIKKCHYLIATGTDLERELRLAGQFRSRPRELAGFINEPFASAIIYPASLAAWVFLALALVSEIVAGVAAVLVFLVGCLGTYLGVKRVKVNQEREDLVLAVVGDGRERSAARRDALQQWQDHCRKPDLMTVKLDELSLRRARRDSDERPPKAWVDVTVGRLERQRALDCRLKEGQEWLYRRSNGMWDGRSAPLNHGRSADGAEPGPERTATAATAPGGD